MLMIAESKKNAIDEDVIKRAQKEEYEKARKWKKDTLKKLSFLKSYGASLRVTDSIKVAIFMYHSIIVDNK